MRMLLSLLPSETLDIPRLHAIYGELSPNESFVRETLSAMRQLDANLAWRGLALASFRQEARPRRARAFTALHRFADAPGFQPEIQRSLAKAGAEKSKSIQARLRQLKPPARTTRLTG
jgi:hypothetical protein